MTKKLFFIIILMILTIVSCGNSSNAKDGCTIGKSFGTRSITRKDITQTCIEEIAKADFAVCGWDRQDATETSKHIAYLQTLGITFGNECKEQDKTVECPNFIPETLKLTKLSGCEVYSIEPDTDCLAPCADLYFSTNDDTFHTVYIGGFGKESITSSDTIKEASLSSELEIGSNKAVFTWSETTEDGSKIEKKVSVEMLVVDPSAVEDEPVSDEDADIEMNEEDVE